MRIRRGQTRPFEHVAPCQVALFSMVMFVLADQVQVYLYHDSTTRSCTRDLPAYHTLPAQLPEHLKVSMASANEVRGHICFHHVETLRKNSFAGHASTVLPELFIMEKRAECHLWGEGGDERIMKQPVGSSSTTLYDLCLAYAYPPDGFTVRIIFQIDSEQLSRSRNIKRRNHMMTSSPLSRLRHYARRQYICFEATFAINAFEPWEKALFFTIFSLIFFFPLRSIYHALPSDLVVNHLWGHHI
ncbi:hypothetical protein SCLCIDRAFT_1094275 [Scleroderma citrinum Foug A]|uniref:Uncharacterized protein n=1 Tax=Scleroderma citrinum Foug A TaxID=1036808 RepID=A0A0C3DQ68_9AGAM|nr:hypothetical protein SCLCIDRAFT_1094275 [Scleroderma citrinum Foug A]